MHFVEIKLKESDSGFKEQIPYTDYKAYVPRQHRIEDLILSQDDIPYLIVKTYTAPEFDNEIPYPDQPVFTFRKYESGNIRIETYDPEAKKGLKHVKSLQDSAGKRVHFFELS